MIILVIDLDYIQRVKQDISFLSLATIKNKERMNDF